MKNAFILTCAVLSLIASRGLANDIGKRVYHCAVVSVVGSWAMANYPTSIDFYFGDLADATKPDSMRKGFLAFSFPSTDWQFPLDLTKLYSVEIDSRGNSARSDESAIRFKDLRFDRESRAYIYELEYLRDSGTYSCKTAWPVKLPH